MPGRGQQRPVCDTRTLHLLNDLQEAIKYVRLYVCMDAIPIWQGDFLFLFPFFLYTFM